MKRIFALIGVLACMMVHGLAQAQLSVYSARWEVAGGGAGCDATPQVAGACNGRRHCRLEVNPNNLCGGDPAFGQMKVLDIKYACDGRRQAEVGFPDGSQAVLRCERPRGNAPLLQIRSARWIGDGAGSCDATPKIAQACNGKEKCEVYVDTRYVCGFDPAFGVVKHLDIQYACNGRQQSMASFTDGNLAYLRCDGSAPNSIYQPPVKGDVPVQQPEPIRHGSHGNSGGNGSYVGTVQILSARWEVIGGGPWCDATPQFGRACNGRSSCQLGVDPYFLCNGDPAPGRLKRVDVKYSCDGRVQPVVGFQDGTQAILRCGNAGVVPPTPPSPPASHLQITQARWEVNGGGPWCDATPQMAQACNGRRFCQVAVEPRNLCSGDPAPGRYKTLEIRYNCNGRPQSVLGFPDGSQALLRCD